jgi:hypothetical protein
MNHQMPKRTHINNSNKSFIDKKQIINKTKSTNFEINSDQDWPNLNTTKVCTFQSDLLASNKKSVDFVKKEEDDDDSIDETADILLANSEPKKPYIEDESKLKKVIKNVDFIKKTVEQHYNYTEGKFSFKDAVLSVPKPLPIINKTSAATFDNVSNQQIKSKKKETALEPTTAVLNQTEQERKKKRCKRSRSKKKTIQKQDTLSDEETKKEKAFDLKKEDFPDLLINSNIKREKVLSLSLDNAQSDAYSSGRHQFLFNFFNTQE